MRIKRCLSGLVCLCFLLAGCAGGADVSPSLLTPPAQTGYEVLEAAAIEMPGAAADGAQRLGADTVLLDFTLDLPGELSAEVSYLEATLTQAGRYAGHIGRIAYYPGNAYDMLASGGAKRIEGFQEAGVDFFPAGDWTAALDKVVYTRYRSDDLYAGGNGREYEHTAYYIILKSDNAYTNGIAGELVYQVCYELDFVTAYIDAAGKRTPVLRDAEILQAVKSFALKGGEPYRPAVGFAQMEALAIEAVRTALLEGDTPQAQKMYAALGAHDAGGLDAMTWHTYWAEEEAGRRALLFAFEGGGVWSIVHVDMDTAQILSVEMAELE